MSITQKTDPESELDNREEQQAQGTAGSAAVEKALAEHDLSREQFIDKLRDLGLSGDDAQKIEEDLGIEMAGVFAIANEDESDYRRHKWLDRNKRERFIASRNPGRLCRGPLLQLARGTHNRRRETGEKPLSKEERRQVREFFEAKTAMHTLGKGGEGLSAVSEITAVTEHRRQTDPDEGDEESSIIGRIFS